MEINECRKRVLVLEDGIDGHLSQSKFIAETIADLLSNKSITTELYYVRVEFKNRLYKYITLFISKLIVRYYSRLYVVYLNAVLTKDTYRKLMNLSSDYVVSFGSTLTAVNFILAQRNISKSIAHFVPNLADTDRFDLVIMFQHDKIQPKENIVFTEGALNIIQPLYLKKCSEEMISVLNLESNCAGDCLGLLIGGHTEGFHLDETMILEVIRQAKAVSGKRMIHILVTTSRRTSVKLEQLIKKEFYNYPFCKVVIIANEKNYHFAVGGILGLSRLVIVSPDSVSMISEAVTSGRQVLVFKPKSISDRHLRFLDNFSENKYIKLCEVESIGRTIEDIWDKGIQVNPLEDRTTIEGALKKIL